MRVQSSGKRSSYDAIKAMILAGELRPGSTLVEQALSKRIGVSRTPIREALQALEKEGFVRIDRYRGASVAELDARDIRELYDLRICFERHSIEEAFRRGRKIDLRPLEDVLARQDEALRADDPNAFVEADRMFHLAILAWHGNIRLETIMLNIWDHVVRGVFVAMRYERKQETALQEHRAIVEAARQGDCEPIVAASRRHLENSLHRVLLGETA